MKDMILSTDNPNKVREIKEILSPLPLHIYSKKQAGYGHIDVIEDKDTLEGNALLKARAIHKASGKTVVADDTGLFVEALNGARESIAHDMQENTVRKKIIG